MTKQSIQKLLKNYKENESQLKYCQTEGVEIDNKKDLSVFKKIKTYFEIMDGETAQILKMLYIDKLSLRECAKESGYCYKTVIRKRDKGIEELAEIINL